MGRSNLTYGGLNGQGELNAGFSDSDHANYDIKYRMGSELNGKVLSCGYS